MPKALRFARTDLNVFLVRMIVESRIGSLAAGVVATTISGYWVQVVEGGVMAAVVVFNAAPGKGDITSLLKRFRHWNVSIPRDQQPASMDQI